MLVSDPKIHIILEGMSKITHKLWEKLEGSPEIWSYNMINQDRRNVFSTKHEGSVAMQIWLLHMIAGDLADDPHLPRPDTREDFVDLIDAARTKFELGDRHKLNVVMPGNHTASTDDIVWDLLRDQSPLISVDQYTQLRQWVRRDRTFVSEIYNLFEAYNDRVQLCWTVLASPEIFKRNPEATESLQQLATQVRGKLSGELPFRLGDTLHQKRPFLPYLFVGKRAGNSLDVWQSKAGQGGFDKPYSTYKSLLDARANDLEPTERSNEISVLVMVVGDLDAHNPIDPPIVTPEVLDNANKAGVDMVLLDSRVGIDVTVNDDSRDSIRVFSV